MVHRSSVPLFWRLKKARYQLVGSKCTECNSVYFPPRILCPKCRRKGNIVEHTLSGNGRIISYTVIRTPPEGFEAPYVVAIIELEDGTNVSGQIVGDIEEIKTGKRVRPVFRRMYEDGEDGLIHYGIKWEIVE